MPGVGAKAGVFIIGVRVRVLLGHLDGGFTALLEETQEEVLSLGQALDCVQARAGQLTRLLRCFSGIETSIHFTGPCMPSCVACMDGMHGSAEVQ